MGSMVTEQNNGVGVLPGGGGGGELIYETDGDARRSHLGV